MRTNVGFRIVGEPSADRPWRSRWPVSRPSMAERRAVGGRARPAVGVDAAPNWWLQLPGFAVVLSPFSIVRSDVNTVLKPVMVSAICFARAVEDRVGDCRLPLDGHSADHLPGCRGTALAPGWPGCWWSLCRSGSRRAFPRSTVQRLMPASWLSRDFSNSWGPCPTRVPPTPGVGPGKNGLVKVSARQPEGASLMDPGGERAGACWSGMTARHLFEWLPALWTSQVVCRWSSLTALTMRPLSVVWLAATVTRLRLMVAGAKYGCSSG